MTDRELVTALRAGDRLAAGQIYDIYGTRLYAYCHELLGDHKVAGDALRDAFIVAVNRIRELRQPDELGAWLYALTRAECHRVGVSEEVPADAGDAARGDRLARLTLDCYAMLPPETREVLDLAFRHRLVDTDLARVLGISEQEATDQVGVAQADLEHALLVVLAARTGDPKCQEAAELGRRFDQLDGRGVAAWVQSAIRHVEKCTVCSATVKNRRPLRLFEELPHSFMPPGVRSRVLESLRDPAGAAFAARIAERAGRFDENGFPLAGARGGARGGRKWLVPAGFAAAVAALGVLLYVMVGQHSPPTSPAANATGGASASASMTNSATPTDLLLPLTPSASASTSASVSASPSAQTSVPAAQMTTPRSVTTTTPPSKPTTKPPSNPPTTTSSTPPTTPSSSPTTPSAPASPSASSTTP
ncbi:sigma-70 family RNA polymerase sigma factor [Actinocrinis puniceicyclus]|uniref:Sigma-70 family RNA polymerase sigma factor n=1 Tax=Actinocrinis puniceicyclus TaxID=977794 RepID=A0A8J7WS90_9ACTN|nr:sigma-70 family RNA polymerase sigma factor [Actinocrinis puniceicyclus]MBS2965042.1 sigma-70 family RNA polymerase sigma factor [Actinocrinis puniceicyclus]